MSRGRSDVSNTDDVPHRDTLDNLVSVDVPRPFIDVPGGPRISDRYVAQRALGADLYLARDLERERDVAIELHRDVPDRQRLHREMLAMSRVAHPNIVTVLAVGEHGGRTFVAREYVEGTSLRHWLADKPRSRLDVLAVLLAAGEGLAAAHAAGILHRNVTPEAIRVGADGRARLTDFGLARKDGPVERPSTEDITLDGARIVAASAYVAPEQMSGQRVGAAADQYAFAVVAFEALLGGRSESRHGRLRSVLLRAQSAEPAARFPTLRALLVAMRRADRYRAYTIAGAIVAAAGVAVAAALLA